MVITGGEFVEEATCPGDHFTCESVMTDQSECVPDGFVSTQITVEYMVEALSGSTFAFYGEATTTLLDEPIPTVSEWGLVVLTLLGMTAGTIVLLGRRRRVVNS